MKRIRARAISAVAVAGLVVAATSLTACSSNKSSGSGSTGGAGPAAAGDASGPVTITVGCEPPKTEPAEHAMFLADIATFEKANPGITVKGDDTAPCDDPTTFNAKLASGKMDNVFYAYYTDAANVMASGQAADIQRYASYVPALSSIAPNLVNLFRQNGTASGDLFGVPTFNYTLGLVYNRQLFSQAGLDPNNPPTTWDQVEADAKQIAALGNGIVGYGDYSSQNTGGWHFTAEMYSRNAQLVSPDGKSATVNNATGQAVLQTLHQMRWVDHSMGDKQLLQYNDLLQMMGAGKLGMYIGAPDNLTGVVDTFGGKYANLGEGPMPGDGGTLLGGDGYMFNKSDSPAQIIAGLKFLSFEFLTPGVGQFNWAGKAANKLPVGIPEPELWAPGSAMQAQTDALAKKYDNMPIANYSKYQSTYYGMKQYIEPPQSQAIYAQGDKVMAAVLTTNTTDYSGLLSTFSNQINSILANSQ
jgi:multiple sugar transport system substrate-binding protein